MTTLTNQNLKSLLGKQFYKLLDLGANSYLPEDRRSFMFLVMAKQLPWNDGVESVPASFDSVTATNEVFRNGIFAKRMSIENASFVVPRINWVSGTIYAQYEDDISLCGINFYVKNYKDQVFKCLWNNDGAASTDEAEIFISNTSLEEPYLVTSDDYKWKYLYTISATEKHKFMTVDWTPVHNNKFVSAAAVNGSLDIITITNSGNNYTNGSSQDIIIVSGDGSSSNLKAVVVNNHVTDIIISNRGTDYTVATISFADVGLGTAAAATASISPQGGHGYDPQFELCADTIMFFCDFVGSESETYPVDNDYRQIFLLHNPKETATDDLAKARITYYTRKFWFPGIGDFNLDEYVFQGVSFDTATFVANVISFDQTSNILYVNNVTGTLSENFSIQGVTSGSLRVVNTSIEPTLKLYSGKVLYISNTLPITRNADQTDRVWFTLSF